jgi:hypothetical protein
MREKPLHLPMTFGEALARIAQTPKSALPTGEAKKVEKTRAKAQNMDGTAGRPPRSTKARKTP